MSYVRINHSFLNESFCKRSTQQKTLSEPCGTWIYGEPGVGKDFDVKEYFKGKIYLKNINKWWCNYNFEPVIFYL